MQQFVYRRLVRKRRWGHACACYACGAAVIPLPLRVNPDVRIMRAYVAWNKRRCHQVQGMLIDRHARSVEEG